MMKNYKPYQARFLLLLFFAFSVVLSQQAPPDATPDPAAVVPPAVTPDPAAAATTPAPAAAPAVEAAHVPPPSWPDTVELDKNTEPILNDPDVKKQKELYKQAKELLKQMREVLREIEKIRETSFNNYLKLNEIVEKSMRDAQDKLGRFKEFLAEKI